MAHSLSSPLTTHHLTHSLTHSLIHLFTHSLTHLTAGADFLAHSLDTFGTPVLSNTASSPQSQLTDKPVCQQHGEQRSSKAGSIILVDKFQSVFWFELALSFGSYEVVGRQSSLDALLVHHGDGGRTLG